MSEIIQIVRMPIGPLVDIRAVRRASGPHDRTRHDETAIEAASSLATLCERGRVVPACA
jgi:hypothetical protein